MSKNSQGINYLEDFPIPYTKKEKAKRLLWNIVWLLFIRHSPRIGMFNGWRRMIYKLFGARLSDSSAIHPSAWVFMPWNLEMAPFSVIGDYAKIYNTTTVKMGRNSIVSQYAYICTTSHNITSRRHEQIDKEVILEDRCWIGTDAFVGMGVTIGEGAVVGARSAVFKDVIQWTVVGGNPARIIKKREIKDDRAKVLL